jgi:hypothetical protein
MMNAAKGGAKGGYFILPHAIKPLFQDNLLLFISGATLLATHQNIYEI